MGVKPTLRQSDTIGIIGTSEMEVANGVSIESQAVKALAQWKATFADEVSRQAKLLAAQGDTPLRVTLQDYQQAAPIVMQSMMAAIATGQANHADRKAA